MVFSIAISILCIFLDKRNSQFHNHGKYITNIPYAEKWFESNLMFVIHEIHFSIFCLVNWATESKYYTHEKVFIIHRNRSSESNKKKEKKIK